MISAGELDTKKYSGCPKLDSLFRSCYFKSISDAADGAKITKRKEITMTDDDFLELWKDRNQERTVIVTDLFPEAPGLALVVCFPPDRVAIAQISLFDDKPF